MLTDNIDVFISYSHRDVDWVKNCLAQAGIHNFLARLALDAGDHETAREHADIAEERAWCDGPPHCYKPALDEAEAMLKELSAKEFFFDCHKRPPVPVAKNLLGASNLQHPSHRPKPVPDNLPLVEFGLNALANLIKFKESGWH